MYRKHILRASTRWIEPDCWHKLSEHTWRAVTHYNHNIALRQTLNVTYPAHHRAWEAPPQFLFLAWQNQNGQRLLL